MLLGIVGLRNDADGEHVVAAGNKLGLDILERRDERGALDHFPAHLVDPWLLRDPGRHIGNLHRHAVVPGDFHDRLALALIDQPGRCFVQQLLERIAGGRHILEYRPERLAAPVALGHAPR